jgi:cell volume regulation protein A
MNREQLSGLLPDDYVLAVAPPEQVHILDALFAARPRGATSAVEAIAFGEFTLDADVPVGTIAKFYSFDIEPEERAKSLAAYMLDHLPSRPVVGDRVQLGPVELVVRRMSKGRITQVGIELEPEPSRFSAAGIWRRVLNRLSPRGLLKRMAGLREKL